MLERIAAVLVGCVVAGVIATSAVAASPTTTISSGPSGTVASTSARFTFTSNVYRASYQCRLDSSRWHGCSSPQTYTGLAQGSHTFSVYAKGHGSSSSSPAATRTWTVDTSPPPAPSVTGAPAAISNDSSPSFRFSDTDTSVTFVCTLDSKSGPCASPVTYTALADGSHSFAVVARDTAGNASQAAGVTWTIDTAPPPAPAITAQPPASTADTSATIQFADSEPGAAFICTLDATQPAACSSPDSLTGLAPGSHTFSVAAADAAGNKSASTSTTWTVEAVKNYLPNPSFEGSLDGWSSYSGTLSLATDGADGADAAKVTQASSNSSFTIYPTVRPLQATTAGTAYTAGGWVRSDVPGKTVCIRIREFDSSGAQTGENESCVGTTTAWQRFTAVNYTTAQKNGQLTAFAIEKNAAAGDTFEVDGLYLNEGTTAPPPPPPPTGQSNYLQNGSFEGSLAGWTSWNASLSLATDGTVGADAAKVSLNAPDTSFSIFPSTRPVASTVAGKSYAATGWVRSDTPGRSVCIRIREFDSSGAQIGQHESCVTSTTAWQQVPTVTYTTTASGGQLTAFAIETGAGAGDSFELDGIQLTDSSGETTGWNSTDPVIAAAGDTACSPTDPDFDGGNGDGAFCMQKATAAVIGSIQGLKALLPLGDNQYRCGDYSDFLQVYAKTWGIYNSISHPIPGNHEYGDFASGCTPSNAQGYFEYFGAIAGNPGQGYYSFNVGTWHLIALNSDCRAVGGCGSGSPEEMWLRNDLATNKTTCTLAYFHIPAFSNGWVGDDLTDYGAWWQDFVNAHTDLVLNGHDHTYQRLEPLDASGLPDPTGPTEVIVGTGGENLAPAPAKNSRLVVGNNTTFGVLKLQLHSDGYDAQFLPIAGQTFSDTFSGKCIP